MLKVYMTNIYFNLPTSHVCFVYFENIEFLFMAP